MDAGEEHRRLFWVTSPLISGATEICDRYAFRNRGGAAPARGAALHSRASAGLRGRRPGSSAYTLRKENKYWCLKNVKHFSPGIKTGNRGSGMGQRGKKRVKGPSSGLLPSQGSCGSRSLFSHTSGCQKLKAFSVLAQKESAFVIKCPSVVWLSGKRLGLLIRTPHPTPQGSVSLRKSKPGHLELPRQECNPV